MYDVKNRLTETTYRKPPAPGGAEGTGALWERVQRTYDPMGNLLAVEGELSGIRVEYQYRPDAPAADPHTHELYRATWMLAGVPWHAVTHGYDAEGRRVSTTVDAGLPGSHAQAFAYDDANRLLSITNDGTPQASFAYASGFLVTTTLGNGNRISRTYDAKGRLESLEHATAAGKTLAKIVYGYDKRDRRTTVQYPHLGITSTFTYTDNSWLASESHAFSTAAPVFGNPEVATYGGNASAPTASATVTPAPPSGSGIALSISYTYDERGNRKTKDVAGTTTGDATYLYDLEDRLLSESRDGGATTVAYAWANRGDMVGRTKTTGAVVESETFVTDYLARITAYSGPTSSWNYIYAPTGDRIAKQHVGLGFEDDNQWDLISDGDVLASYHKSGATEVFDSIYVSPGTDGRLARIDGAGTASYFMNDALNSVHQVTGAGGALSGTEFNDAWGNAIDIGLGTPGGLNGRFSYTNRERDNESGLMFYRARSYDAMSGRFTSRDPAGSSLRYAYAANNPLTYLDPTGATVVSADEALTKRLRDEIRARGITKVKDSEDTVSKKTNFWIPKDQIENSKPNDYDLSTEILWRQLITTRTSEFNSIAEWIGERAVRRRIVEAAKWVAHPAVNPWDYGNPNVSAQDPADPPYMGDEGFRMRTPGERRVRLGCLQAKTWLQIRGVERALGKEEFDKRAGSVSAERSSDYRNHFFGQHTRVDDPTDWIPGDAGYFENLDLIDRPGLEDYWGQHVIYIGGSYATGAQWPSSRNFYAHDDETKWPRILSFNEIHQKLRVWSAQQGIPSGWGGRLRTYREVPIPATCKAPD